MNNYFIEIQDGKSQIYISILIPIVILVLGYFFNLYYGKVLKKNKAEITKNIIENWPTPTEATILKQIDDCKEFAKDLNDLDQIRLIPLNLYNSLINKINNIDFKELAEAFVLNLEGNEKDNIKNLHKLIANIDYISSFDSQLDKTHKIFVDYTDKYTNEWNNVFREFFNIRLKYIQLVHNNKQHPSMEYFNKFILITNEWNKNNPNLKSLKLTINDLINPINDLCNKYVTENIVDEMAVEIIPVLEEIKFIIKKWDVAKNGTVERIIMQANDLKAEYESLIEVIMIFKKQNIKRVFKIK